MKQYIDNIKLQVELDDEIEAIGKKEQDERNFAEF